MDKMPYMDKMMEEKKGSKLNKLMTQRMKKGKKKVIKK